MNHYNWRAQRKKVTNKILHILDLEACAPKLVNFIIIIIGVNSLRLVGHIAFESSNCKHKSFDTIIILYCFNNGWFMSTIKRYDYELWLIICFVYVYNARRSFGFQIACENNKIFFNLNRSLFCLSFKFINSIRTCYYYQNKWRIIRQLNWNHIC